MPAQFAYDPPSWLSLRHPGVLIKEEGIDDFVKNYTPRLEQFLRATERAEDKVGSMSTTGPLLLIRMQEAWDSKQFWFKYALRRCLDVDAVYWAVLHESDDGDGSSLLDLATRETLPQVVQRKNGAIEGLRGRAFRFILSWVISIAARDAT
jgi:hypothetical protein